MNKAMTSQKLTRTSNLDLKKITKLFELSTELADLAEDILESRGEYSREFIRGLEKSLFEVREGKSKRINSLADLR